MNKTAKTVRIFLLISLIAALAATFSACSIIDSLFKTSNSGTNNEQENGAADVKSVSLSPVGITATDGVFSVELGKEFSVTATTEMSNGSPDDITYKWYVVAPGEDGALTPVSGFSGKTLTYTLTEFNSERYEIFVTAGAGNVKSTSIYARTLYSGLDGVSVLPVSASYSVVDDAITLSAAETGNLELKAVWNKNYMEPTATCTFGWYVGDSAVAASTAETFSFPLAGSVSDTTVKLVMNSGSVNKEKTITVKQVAKYKEIEKVVVTVSSGATAFGSGAATQYKQSVASSAAASIGNVTLTATTYPTEGTNTNAKVTWTMVTKENSGTAAETGRTFDYTPVYGENYVYATIDNVSSAHTAIVVLTAADYAESKEEIETPFVWRQGVYNRYITSQSDLDVFVSYIAAQHKTGVDYSYRTGNGFEITNDNGALGTALGKMEEAGTFRISATNNSIQFTSETVFGNPNGNYTPATDVTQVENVVTHYESIAAGERRTSLPIDSAPVYPEKVANSDMLYRVVGWGYKPTFGSDAAGVKLASLYDDARAVLLEYISEDMTDYEKVRAIYEWIAQKVDYDYAIVEATLTSSERLQFNAFFLEGVFSDADGSGHGQAVCDGRAKAFVLLCGMEGITSTRVTGEAKGEGHAWNKVLVDPDGDGKKDWYLCDTTWSDRSGSDHEEKLNMQYFLVTDSYVTSSHTPDEDSYNPVANTAFNYYASTVVENGDDDFDLYIESREALAVAAEYSRTQGKYVDIKVATAVASSSSIMRSRLSDCTPPGYTISVTTTDQSNGLYLIYIYIA